MHWYKTKHDMIVNNKEINELLKTCLQRGQATSENHLSHLEKILIDCSSNPPVMKCLQLFYVELHPKVTYMYRQNCMHYPHLVYVRQSRDSHRRTVRRGPETVSSIILSSFSP